MNDRTRESLGAVRTLYFHTGTHKTGSTALQAYLAANATLLGEAGVGYKFWPGTYQSMGNGQHLFAQMSSRTISDSRLEELLGFYLADRTVAICSSEDFTRFTPQEWKQVKEACQRLNVQARFVTFVRDVGPYYFSLYGQLIKAGEIHTSFEDYCKSDQYFPVLDSLKCLLEQFGRESMSIVHYESAIDHMDSVFMAAVGHSAEQYDSSLLQQPVNRSLTEYEQEILVRINGETGQAYSLELSVHLMNKRPHLKPSKQFNPDLVEILRSRHATDIAWINQTFFGGREVVKISGNTSGNSVGNALSDHDKQAIDRDVANWCISKFQSVQDGSIKFVADRLSKIDWQNASDPVVPEDFDPIAYSLLNPDLFKAGVPPYQHFITSGKNEHGRKWKWPNH